MQFAALIYVLAAGPLYAQWTPEELPLNVKVTLKPSHGPLTHKEVPKVLGGCFIEKGVYATPFVNVYQFKARPGQRYTAYESFPCDGVERRVSFKGQTPFTDKSVDKAGAFVMHTATARRVPNKWDTYGINFEISAQSENNIVYVVAAFARRDAENYLTIRDPAESDSSVGKSDPSKRYWGHVKTDRFLLKNVPGSPLSALQTEKAKTTGPTPSGSDVLAEAPTSRANAPGVAYGSRVEAYIDRGDYDTYRIDFQGGVLKARSEGDLDLVADLLDAGGKLVARNGHEGNRNFTIERSLPAGTYYIVIRVMHHGGEGAYTLALGDSSGKEYRESRR